MQLTQENKKSCSSIVGRRNWLINGGALYALW
jgi:hypothetical protein